MAEFIPESDEVRAEKRRRMSFDLSEQTWKASQWFKNLDYDATMKVYLAGIFCFMGLSVIGGGLRTVVNWCLAEHRIKESQRLYELHLQDKEVKSA